jgi:lysophospholipase L1-like esterase
VPVVVFAGPVDEQLLDGQRIWDRAEYERNLAFVKQYVEARGGTFLDYTRAVPGENLIDSHHPMATGYEKLASAIASDLAPLARSIEASKSAGR